MSENERWVAAIVTGLVSLMGGGSAIWVVFRKRRAEDAAADLENNHAATKFLREEIFKMLTRERKDRDDMRQQLAEVSKELAECTNKHAVAEARLEYVEAELAKLGKWQRFSDIVKSDENPEATETKRA